MKTKSVLFAGIGGQGIIRASSVLAMACLNSGLDVKQSEVHGMAQRGGSVVSYVRFGEKVYSPTIEPKGADIVMMFEKSETLRWINYLKEGGFLLINDQAIYPTSLIHGKKQYPTDEKILSYLDGIDYQMINSIEEAKKIGNPKVFNTIMLGAVAKRVDTLEKEAFIEAIKKGVPPKTIDLNLKAFEFGYNL